MIPLIFGSTSDFALLQYLLYIFLHILYISQCNFKNMTSDYVHGLFFFFGNLKKNNKVYIKFWRIVPTPEVRGHQPS